MDDDITDPTEAEFRLTALQLAIDFARSDPKANATSVLTDANAFMAFLKGDNDNV